MKKIYLTLLLALVAGLSCQVPSGSSPPEDALAPTVADVLAQLEAASPPEHPVDLRPRPRPPSTFVPASPDTRSQKDIAAAACWGFEDGHKAWRCKGAPPKTFMASASTPIIPSSWTVPAWFVDPQNLSGTASDGNACTTSGAPCLTYQEINVHRWGCQGNPDACPRLRQNTTVTFLSSHTDGTDPVYFNPSIENGAVVTLQGTTPTVATSTTFTLVAAKNRTAGANSTLQGSFAAGSPAAGVMLQNTTAGKSSRAWIYKTAGGANWNITQPATPVTPPFGPFAFVNEVDTWASTDTVNLLTPVQVNIVQLTPTLAGKNGGATNGLQVYQLVGFAPTATDILQVNGYVTFVESFIQRLVNMQSPSTVFFPGMYANTWLSGLASGPCSFTFQAGAVVGGLTTDVATTGGQSDRAYFTQDAIINTTGHTSSLSGLFVDFIFLDSAVNVTGPWIVQGGVGGVIYGGSTADLQLSNAARVSTKGGTWTNTMTYPIAISTGFLLNGSRNGNSIAYAGAVGTIHNGIATTVANMDAAAGAAGFGGVAFNPGGAMLSNAQ